MKPIKYLLILCISALTISCSKDGLKYDFSKIESEKGIDSLLQKIQLENKDAEIDTLDMYHELEIKGMHYAGVPIKKAVVTGSKITLTTDTINFNGKKLLETLEAKNGLTALEDNYNEEDEFVWDSETKDLDFIIEYVNGKHLAAIGDKDIGELTINYKKVYSVPLANIHKKIQTFDTKPNYALEIQYGYCDCEYTILVNNVIIAEDTKKREFILNDYITNASTPVKIIVKPEINDNGVRAKNFKGSEMFKADIYDASTEKVVKTIEQTSLAGKTTTEFVLDFSSTLPWYPEAWTNGVDLRKDKDLKQKIKALYTKIGEAFLKKDEQAINDIFYHMYFETQQLKADTNYVTAKRQWEIMLEIKESIYKYTVADAFEIEYNANGKLIYTYPTEKSDMLIFTGKQYDNSMNYFLYQPKGANELKIIR